MKLEGRKRSQAKQNYNAYSIWPSKHCLGALEATSNDGVPNYEAGQVYTWANDAILCKFRDAGEFLHVWAVSRASNSFYLKKSQ